MNDNVPDLKTYLRIIVRYKRFIIWGSIICALAAGIVSFIMPQTYQSSLLLEIGKIYLPPRDMTKQETEFIEEPKSAAHVIESEAVLNKVSAELNLDIPLRKLRKKIEVETFNDVMSTSQKEGSPLVKIICEASEPQETVDVLTLLASTIVDQHKMRYQSNQQSLKNLVMIYNEKIASMQKVVSTQQKYRQQIQLNIDKTDKTADKFSIDLSELDSSKISPIEFLFLQSSSSAQRKSVNDLREIIAELDTLIGENQEKIGEYKDEIVNLESLNKLSTPTRIRSPAILPDHATSPNKLLNIIIAGLLGLILTILISFFHVYWTGE